MSDLLLCFHKTSKEGPLSRVALVLIVLVLTAGLVSNASCDRGNTMSGVPVEFWKACESNNTAAMLRLLAPSGAFSCFGTRLDTEWKSVIADSAGPRGINAPAPTDASRILAWETGQSICFHTLQSIKSGNLGPLVAQLDKGGASGSVFCQVPADIMAGGKLVHILVRLAAVLKKESGQWRITGRMIAFSRVDRSLAATKAKSR